MDVITQTAMVGKFTRQHTHQVAFLQVQLRCVQMEPTVSVSIEAGLAPIMGALSNGSDKVWVWAFSNSSRVLLSGHSWS
jgi:hypothetical protein